MDAYVEVKEIQVLRVKADMEAQGPSAAFKLLESKLPSLKARKFYGVFHVVAGCETYYACVERTELDDPAKMQLDTGTIPGGWYARRKLLDWGDKISQLPKLFQEMSEAHDVDPSRPSIEFYRSETELQLLVPVYKRPSE